MIPGEVLPGPEPVDLFGERPQLTLEVVNTGDRPVQVGSHYHFAEANPGLDFDRGAARGLRLNIAAGTAVRFEPGDRKPVTLVELGGAQRPGGMSGLVDGSVSNGQIREQAIARALDRGFDLEAGA